MKFIFFPLLLCYPFACWMCRSAPSPLAFCFAFWFLSLVRRLFAQSVNVVARCFLSAPHSPSPTPYTVKSVSHPPCLTDVLGLSCFLRSSDIDLLLHCLGRLNPSHSPAHKLTSCSLTDRDVFLCWFVVACEKKEKRNRRGRGGRTLTTASMCAYACFSGFLSDRGKLRVPLLLPMLKNVYPKTS